MADDEGLVLQQPQNLLGPIALQYGGLAAIPAVQRSQYLSAAIRQMQANAPAMRTQGSLWSNLAANAILALSQRQAMKQEMQAAQGGMQTFGNAATQGIYGPSGAPASGDAAPAASTPATPQAQAPAQAAAPSSDAFEKFLQFWAPHEGAYNAKDTDGGQDFWGLDTRSNPDLAGKGPMTLAQAAPLIQQRVWDASGAPQIAQTNPALAVVHADTFGLSNHIANGALQASGGDVSKYIAAREAGLQALVNANPAKFGPVAKGWANRSNDLAAYASQMGAPAQPQNLPPPNQVATNGPLPGAALGGGGQPPAPGGPPTGPYATPQEAAYIHQMMSYPAGSMMWQAGVQKAMEVQQRAMSPAKLPEGDYYGPDGRARSALQYQDVPVPGGVPGDLAQRGPDNHLYVTAEPGATSGNSVWDAGQGKFVTARGLGGQLTGGFTGNPTVYMPPGGGAPQIVQQPFDPEKARGAFMGDQAVKDYGSTLRVAQGFYNALNNAVGKNNGVLGTTAVDALIQSYGLTPRGATADQVVKAMGFPETIESAILKTVGSGGMTPQAMQQIASVIQAETQSARAQAAARMQSDTSAYKAYDPRSNGVPGEADLVPPAPSPPSLKAFGGQPAQPAPGGMNAQQALQEARQAILQGAPRAAVIQRLQAWGVNPAGL